MILTPLHDCTVDAMFGSRSVRHRAPIDFTEVKLNAGHLRLEGIRCDGTPIALYGNRNGSTLVAYNEDADNPADTDRHERNMLDEATGREWISRNCGPWEPLIEFPDQPAADGQPSLLDALSGDGAA